MKTDLDAAKERRAKENRRDRDFPIPSGIDGGDASWQLDVDPGPSAPTSQKVRGLVAFGGERSWEVDSAGR